MTVLVIGGSGSGKSAYAERRTDFLSAGKKKYYLATMKSSDEETQRKIERHRKMRAGRGFCTIEQPTDIEDIAGRIGKGEGTALLECVSNLTANEMFAESPPKTEKNTVEKIVKGIQELRKNFVHLVIVSNNVFEDGIIYEESTMAYIKALGRINERLAAAADEVVEVTAGIPLVIKEKNVICTY